LAKSILVVGGAGYVGSHSVKLLSEQGYRVSVVDNFVTGHKSFCKWGDYFETDISDSQSLDTVLKKVKPDAVLNFAAHTYVGESVQDPDKYYRNNVFGTLSLVNAMRKINCKKLVFSSSCAVYGVPNKVPIDETEKKDPISPYGFTKFVVERMLEDFSTAYGMNSVSLRYFNAAGADPDCEIGENHIPETHLIPLILMVAAGLRDNITIYGDDYQTPDGTCVRDYIHVCDLASAHVKALEYLLDGKSTTAVNLGVGRGYSVKEIIACVNKVTGREIPVIIGKRRPGDPAQLVADPDLAHKLLNWSARYTDIELTIEHAWSWLKKQNLSE